MCEQALNFRVSLDPLIKKVAANLIEDVNNVHYDLSPPNDSFFFSDMFFVDIIVNPKNEEKKKTFSVVLKKPPQLDYIREVMNSDAQFHNEILFYERYSKDDKELPRCFYTEEKPPVDSVIVLENLTRLGYKLSEWKFDVPLEYTIAAFRKIARFHAKGYAMKEQRPKEFFDIVGSIWETRFKEDSTMRIVINGTVTRSLEFLRKRGHDENFCDALEAKFQDAFNNVVMKIVEPEDPLATLCHGDFTMNNTFFKRENGQLKALVFDFALMRYGSPVIDLSTFLCLHCARDLDKNLLNNVLKVYHDSLIECLKERGVENCDKYSYEVVYQEFKKKGIFGFFIATFFLGMVMGKCTMSPEELVEIGTEKSVVIMREMGGDEISEILANMLLKLKEFGCLDDLM